MIKTPVKRHEMFTSSFVDKYGCFLDDAQMNDAQKRINMHDELVKSLTEMCEMWLFVCECNGYDENHMNQYKSAKELLERCK